MLSFSDSVCPLDILLSILLITTLIYSTFAYMYILNEAECPHGVFSRQCEPNVIQWYTHIMSNMSVRLVLLLFSV